MFRIRIVTARYHLVGLKRFSSLLCVLQSLNIATTKLHDGISPKFGKAGWVVKIMASGKGKWNDERVHAILSAL